MTLERDVSTCMTGMHKENTAVPDIYCGSKCEILLLPTRSKNSCIRYKYSMRVGKVQGLLAEIMFELIISHLYLRFLEKS